MVNYSPFNNSLLFPPGLLPFPRGAHSPQKIKFLLNSAHVKHRGNESSSLIVLKDQHKE